MPGRQCAALPVRGSGEAIEVLLVTSRDTGRWVLPKGWVEKGWAPPDMAAREAFEEAGVEGRIRSAPIGSYTYDKRLPKNRIRVCKVHVFVLEVERELDAWPEMDQRQRRWMTPGQAAYLVAEGGLVDLLLRIAADPGHVLDAA
ncbi:MAG TPA: NUDIX hydrolase [Azospirillaceae bacterium]|nr:NUDIX hydrolase [Azospirillaceae bacterium]